MVGEHKSPAIFDVHRDVRREYIQRKALRFSGHEFWFAARALVTSVWTLLATGKIEYVDNINKFLHYHSRQIKMRHISLLWVSLSVAWMTPVVLLARSFDVPVMRLGGGAVAFSVAMSVFCLCAAVNHAVTSRICRALAILITIGAALNLLGGIYVLVLRGWSFTKWLSIFEATLVPLGFLEIEHPLISAVLVFLVVPLSSLALALFCRWGKAPETEPNIIKTYQRPLGYLLAILWLLTAIGWAFSINYLASIIGGARWIAHMGMTKLVVESGVIAVFCLFVAIGFTLTSTPPRVILWILLIFPAIHFINIGIDLAVKSLGHPFRLPSILEGMITIYYMIAGRFQAHSIFMKNISAHVLPLATMVLVLISFPFSRINIKHKPE